jgi:hypothetical protein
MLLLEAKSEKAHFRKAPLPVLPELLLPNNFLFFHDLFSSDGQKVLIQSSPSDLWAPAPPPPTALPGPSPVAVAMAAASPIYSRSEFHRATIYGTAAAQDRQFELPWAQTGHDRALRSRIEAGGGELQWAVPPCLKAGMTRSRAARPAKGRRGEVPTPKTIVPAEAPPATTRRRMHTKLLGKAPPNMYG